MGEEAAKAGVTQLLHDYCEIVDACSATGDWQTYGAKWCDLFPKDGIFHESKPMQPNKYGAKVMKGLCEAFKQTSHQVTNINVKLDPKEPGVAWAHCKLYAWHRPHSDTENHGKTDWELWGTYQDKCVVQPDGSWRFSYRWVQQAGDRGPSSFAAQNPIGAVPTPQIEFPKSLSSRL